MPVLSRTLNCGATILIEPLSGVRSVALSWYVPGGVADEPSDRLGLSAVWSEMLMRGSSSLDSRQQADATAPRKARPRVSPPSRTPM